ncbi:MAG: phospholipid/cholesterol/gamma-HCH transport system substrate-binding protein [Thermoleophilaceae bacterium]|nr:phospholipid/cholesterol/gamma-HCH transport system substrate-binding protein [Thermoleophilaceae bacterium]
MRRGHEPRISPFQAGVIAVLLIAIGSYFAFAKALPFKHHYQVKFVIENANLVQPKSTVRIAGIDVGQVDTVERYRHTKMALVTMRIADRGRPIHRDATLKIRPRLFLEGNFYVDLKPGTSASPELPDGGMIPITQTARPVQLDQILGSLSAPTRSAFRGTLHGLADAFDTRGPHGEPTGAEALNKTLATSPQSLRDSAVVGQALVGPTGHELSAAIKGFAKAAKAVADNEDAATALVRDFNTTMAALAARAPALKATVAQLGPTSINVRRGFASLQTALPATRQFARDLIPGVEATPAAIDASRPWIAQAKPLLSERELGGWLRDLEALAPGLAGLAVETKRFLPSIDDFNRCITGVILPSGNVKLDDGAHSVAVENYKELWYAMVGQAGEGAGFDGNGSFLRLAASPGDLPIETGKTNWGKQSYFTTTAFAPQATRPAFTSKLPPLRRDVKCYTQPAPNPNGAGSTGPADGSRPGAAAPPIAEAGLKRP